MALELILVPKIKYENMKLKLEKQEKGDHIVPPETKHVMSNVAKTKSINTEKKIESDRKCTFSDDDEDCYQKGAGLVVRQKGLNKLPGILNTKIKKRKKTDKIKWMKY